MTEVLEAAAAGIVFPDDLQGTQAVPFAPEEFRAWVAFLRSHALVSRRLETELTERAHLSLAYYDVLVQLAIVDGRALRMHELADRVLLSRSGVTRLVDRLEHEGLVRRRTCASDGRGSYAEITAAGMARLREATPEHLLGIRRHFLDLLTPEEMATLSDLLGRVAAGNA